MATTQDYINQLKIDKQNLVSMLNNMGVEATNTETFTSLTPKVGKIVTDPILQDKTVEITDNGTQTIKADSGYDGLNEVEVITNIASSGGGDTPEKGLIINKYDENGIITEVTIKGLSEIPTAYLGSASSGYITAIQPSKIIFDGIVTKINDRAFNRLQSLKEIVSINSENPFENVTEIGGSAFAYCSGMQMQSICLPNLVTLGVSHVFRTVASLKYMWIGDKITSISTNTLYGTSLNKLYIDLPRAVVETFEGYANNAGTIVCNDDEGFMTKEQFDAIDWATYAE